METLQIVVIGAGGHAAEVCSYVRDLAEGGAHLALAGCVDDQKAAGMHAGLPVLGPLSSLPALATAHGRAFRCITALGHNPTREQVVRRIEKMLGRSDYWWTLRHPLAFVSREATVGAGTCLAPGAKVTARATVGAHVILNVNASIAHDTIAADFVNVNPGAAVAGNARLGAGCYIGAGATVIDKITVGEWTIVGAGAAVVRDLPPHSTAVGVPARVIKQA